MKLNLVLFRAIRYLKYWLLKTDQHSLQAPFSYEFYTHALCKSSRKTVRDSGLEALRAFLILSGAVINKNDRGAGSSIRKDKPARVGQIAKIGISNRSKSEILVNIIAHSDSKRILELGTSLGINTMYLAQRDNVEHVDTIEGNAELVEIAKKNFKEFEQNKIALHHGDIKEVFGKLIDIDKSFDLIFIDANHTYEATIEYFELIKKMSSHDTITVFDDINWSKGMARAWKEIKEFEHSGLTFENFNFGILFINPSLMKSNHVLDF